MKRLFAVFMIPAVFAVVLAGSLSVRAAEDLEGAFENAMLPYVEGDFEAAFPLIADVAEKGHARAQYTLAFMYEYGKGTPPDEKKALFWYEQSAKSGEPGGFNALGVAYMNAKLGTEKDGDRALEYFLKAGKQGLGLGYLNAGKLLYFGRVVPQDYGRAYKYFQRALALGEGQAAHLMGLQKLNGFGIKKDLRGAVHLLKISAVAFNYDRAQASLGLLAESGLVPGEDEVDALKWYLLSVMNGYPRVQRQAEMLKAKLTPEQIALAEQRAKVLRKKIKE